MWGRLGADVPPDRTDLFLVVAQCVVGPVAVHGAIRPLPNFCLSKTLKLLQRSESVKVDRIALPTIIDSFRRVGRVRVLPA